MKHKPALRHAVDLLMTIALLLLMAYVLTDQAVHEWLGIGFFALFVLHHLLNLSWFRALGKGRYSAPRVLSTVLDALVLVSMLAQMVSGIAMSRSALPFLDLPLPTSAARLLHLACGYWSLLLVGLHLGAHWGAFLSLGRKALRRGRPLPAWGRNGLRLGAALLAGAGLFCFLRQGIPSYFFLRTEFAFLDYEASALQVLGELFCILVLWVLAGTCRSGAPSAGSGAGGRRARAEFLPSAWKVLQAPGIAKKEAVQRFLLYSFFSIGAKDGT